MSKDNGGPAGDRELLEMAANAAGIDLRWKLGVHQITLPPALPYYLVGGLDKYWNPLTDDGDALRLAVRLNLLGWLTDEHAIGAAGMHELDPYEATRRAIVRAAAAIGGAM